MSTKGLFNLLYSDFSYFVEAKVVFMFPEVWKAYFLGPKRETDQLCGKGEQFLKE